MAYRASNPRFAQRGRPPVPVGQPRPVAMAHPASAAGAARLPAATAAPPPFQFESERGTLHVRIRSAANLPAADLQLLNKEATSDPYVRLQFGQRPPQRTKSVPKNLSPLWGESFRFNGVSLRELSNTPLRLLVCDEDKGRLRELGSTQDDVLGQLEVRLDAARVRSTDPSKHEYKLTFQPAANLTVRRGQQPILEFAVYWTAGGPPAPANALPQATATPAPPQRPPVRPAQVRPGQAEAAARAAVAARSPQGAATTPGAETGTLQLRIKSAANLRAADLSLVKAATSDPYCRCSFGKWEQRTRTVKKNCSPVWEETFYVEKARRPPARLTRARPPAAAALAHTASSSQVSVRELGTTPLRLVVWDEDKGRLRELGSSKDDVLGEITLMLDIARLR